MIVKTIHPSKPNWYEVMEYDIDRYEDNIKELLNEEGFYKIQIHKVPYNLAVVINDFILSEKTGI